MTKKSMIEEPLASRCRHVVITSLALLDFSAVVNASGSARSSTGTNIPPAARMAKAHTIHTGELGAQSATAVPRSIPLWRSP